MPSSYRSKYSYISELPGFFIKTGIGLLVFILIIVIWKGLGQEGYTMQPFQVPDKLEESGLTGLTFANRVVDHLNEIKGTANSERTDTLSLIMDTKPDLNLEVMGLGLSSSNMTYHIREFLGVKSKVDELALHKSS